MKARCSGEKGFSLVEMMVAMLITVIVSGAIFGLMTASQTAFRREPARSDQQQSMRAAMDLITRDVASAGSQLSPWVQAFTSLELQGLPVGEAGAALFNAGPNGSDFLQIVGSDGSCPTLGIDRLPAGGPFCGAGIAVCPPAPGTQFVFVGQAFPQCFGAVPPAAGPALMAAIGPASYFVGTGVAVGNPPGGVPVYVDFLAAPPPRVRRCGGTPATTCPGGPPTDTTSIVPIQVVRYEIAPDPPPPLGSGDGVPGLWRSATGGVNLATGGYVAAPAAAGNWQLVARGIEDLAVCYTPAGTLPTGVPCNIGNSPPVVAAGNFATLVQQVQVTITGRTIVEGQLNRAAGGADFRSSLTAVGTPRAALATLSTAPPPFTWQ